MNRPITIGFPHMEKESGEKRAFLPGFIQYLSQFAEVYLGEGYGSRLGFSFDDYCQGNKRVLETSRREAFEMDYVIILRSPNEEEYTWMTPGSVLVSMLHYPTRPRRVQILRELGLHAISLDSIVDDNNLRLVENMRAVAWNGIEAAFDVFERTWPNLLRSDGRPFRTLILGTGMVGKHAIEAAAKLGDVVRNNRHIERGGPGSLAISVGRNISDSPEQMRALFEQVDILVDATQRRNPAVPVVPNDWIAWLPQHAVIVDLSVDPYLLDNTPPTVRGVEGIPQGDLNQYIFSPDDPAWERTVPAGIPCAHRRATVTCYSWPGVHPEACMEHYARQMEPLAEVLLTTPYEEIALSGGYFHRALARAKLPGD